MYFRSQVETVKIKTVKFYVTTKQLEHAHAMLHMRRQVLLSITVAFHLQLLSVIITVQPLIYARILIMHIMRVGLKSHTFVSQMFNLCIKKINHATPMRSTCAAAVRSIFVRMYGTFQVLQSFGICTPHGQ